METTELQTTHGGAFTWWKNTCYFEGALMTRLYCNFQYRDVLAQLQVFSKVFM